jgi:MFS family permease
LTPKPLTQSIASLFPFCYGWVIVAVSLISLMVAYGIWWSFPIFYVSMLKEFGWSRAGTAAIFTIGSIVYGFCSLPAGALIDRVGPRKLLPAAAALVAVGCLISSAATEKWHFYLSYGAFMGIGTICMGYVPISALISNWFVQRRGKALGIGAWAGGVIFDAAGSYFWAVCMTLPAYALMCASFWFMAPRKVRRIITPYSFR